MIIIFTNTDGKMIIVDLSDGKITGIRKNSWRFYISTLYQ
jgi:hypothetical protein